MKVYCTRPCTHDQQEPHSTEVAEEALRIERKIDRMLCATCGMPLILNGRYVPIKKLGQGGFGYTFLALDLKFGLDSKRVIKQFRSDLLLSAGQMALAKRAFEREYKIQDQLKHQQIPRVYEPFDVEAPTQGNTNRTVYYYFVQEYIEGEDLQKKLKNRQQSNSTFSEVEVQDILKQVLEVLHCIHSSSPPIIHLDIKPSNIIQTVDGSCYLVDFGAVKQVLPVSDPSRQTTILGTPGYAPPEQFDGTVDFSSDLYALARTCICLLTGSPSSPPPWGVSDLLTKVLKKMISLDPQMRYRSVTAVKKEFETPPILELNSGCFRQNKWLSKVTAGIFTAAVAVLLIKYIHYNILVKPADIKAVLNSTEDKGFNDIGTPDGIFKYGCSTAWVLLIDEVKRTIKETHPSFILQPKSSESPEECKASKNGLTMLDNNQLEIGLSSKKSVVKAKNSAVMKRALIAQSAVVMVVHKESKIESVSGSEFNKIRAGEINSWKKVGGEDSAINLYSTNPEYTDRKNFIKVNSSEEGVSRVNTDLNGVMIVPIQIAAKHCNKIKVLSIKKEDGFQLDPFQSKCSDSGEAEVSTKMIANLSENGLEEFILNLEIVFRTDREESEKSGEALVKILRSKKGREMITKVGYVPIES
jgi:serine/threonine protein kinase